MGWTQFLRGLRYCLYIYFIQYMGIFYMYIYYIGICDGSFAYFLYLHILH